MNSLTIAGHIGKIGELKYTKSDKKVIGFSVAVRNRDATDWFECEAWDKTAEYLLNYGFSGAPVCVQGEIHFRDYTDKENNKRKAVEVTVRSLDIMAKKPDVNSDQVKVPGQMKPDKFGAPPVTIDEVPLDIASDDLPF